MEVGLLEEVWLLLVLEEDVRVSANEPEGENVGEGEGDALAVPVGEVVRDAEGEVDGNTETDAVREALPLKLKDGV